MEKCHTLIIGGGFAGLAAAKRLARTDLSVTLVDKTNHHLFQPLLYQVATAGLNPSEIASPIRTIFKKKSNVTCLMASLSSIDFESSEAWFDQKTFSISYDFLILGIGGMTSYFGHNSWEEIAPGLKSIDDALKIRQKVLCSFEQAEKSQIQENRDSLMTIVVVGGGPTGVEMAGALAELRSHVLRWDFRLIDPRDVRVILIEGNKDVLSIFPNKLQKYARRQLEKLGVEVLTEEFVKDIGPGYVQTDQQKILSHNIIWTAGVGGHKLAEDFSDQRDKAGKVIVDADLRLPGHENVYCVGDMIHYAHPHTFGGKIIPGVAPAAMQQGLCSAKNIIRQTKGKPTKRFHYFDKGSMATIGRSSAVVLAPPPIRIMITGLIAWVAWLFIHLLYIVDYRNRLLVLARWSWKYLSWKWNVRLIMHPNQNTKQK